MTGPKSLLQLLVLLFSLSDVFGGRDFYKILGVSKRADTNTIKKAYRKLAKALHPDKNPDDPEAEQKFQDLGVAYETLKDPDLRKIYDKGGEEAIQKNERGGGGSPFDSFFGGGGSPFDDFFGFGGEQRGGTEEYHLTRTETNHHICRRTRSTQGGKHRDGALGDFGGAVCRKLC